MPLLSLPQDDLFASRSKTRTLRLLAGSSLPLSGREVARRIRMGLGPKSGALRELVDMGVVQREGSPTHALYRLAREHPVVMSMVEPLFQQERGWTGTLFDAITSWLDDLAVASGVVICWSGIYGSVARGEDTPESDVDLAIVVANDDDAATIRRVILAVPERWFSARLSTLVLARARLRTMREEQDALYLALRDEARRLSGPPTVDSAIDDEA